MSAVTVRLLVGAERAYACIRHPGGSLDVALAPGRSPAAALREQAGVWRAEAARLEALAALAGAAAEVV